MILTIDKTHELKGNGYLLGVDGENGSEQLIIKIENETLLDKWVYIEFDKDNGEKFTTERLSVVGGQIVYDIPNGLLPQGHVKVQVIFRDADGFVWKTFVRQFAVDKSLNASDNLPIEYPDFIGEAQKLLDEISVESEKVDEVLESEEARKTAETARETAETERTENETARVTAEQGRANAEAERASSEEVRKANETAREKAETARRTEFAGWSESLGNLNTYDKRLINLEEAGVGVLFDIQEDDSTAYIKGVPENALPYARIDEVGDVKSINSVGKNLFANGNITGVSFKEVTLSKPLSAGTYMFSTIVNTADTDDTGCQINFADKNGNTIVHEVIWKRGVRQHFCFTIETECTKIFFYASTNYPRGEGDAFEYVDTQIEKGETATAYEQYKANTYTVPLTDNYIKVEPNGSVVFENDNGQAVPSEITFFVKK
jgi:hypothetical protein